MTKRHLSQWRLEQFFISITFVLMLLPSIARAAPYQNDIDIQHYEEGCYYNYNHYNEGDRILTNEPCLNCTCHNKMLMCYLRVCPFTKPIGHDCTVEKREDQCCPIITCPEVHVDVSHHSAELGSELSFPEKFGCSIGNKFYPEGAQVPSNPNKPCELCYCIKNRTSCLMQECTLHIDGCIPIYNKGSCCPVRYNCDHENDIMELESESSETTTTIRPTQGFILTTTMTPSTYSSCFHNGQMYLDGSSVYSKNNCEHCYCMRGDIVCAVQECDLPILSEKGKSCRPLPADNGNCCPKNYLCDDESITTELLETTTYILEDVGKPITVPPAKDIHGLISDEDLQLQAHIDDDEREEEVHDQTTQPQDVISDIKLASVDELVVGNVTESSSAIENALTTTADYEGIISFTDSYSDFKHQELQEPITTTTTRTPFIEEQTNDYKLTKKPETNEINKISTFEISTHKMEDQYDFTTEKASDSQGTLNGVNAIFSLKPTIQTTKELDNEKINLKEQSTKETLESNELDITTIESDKEVTSSNILIDNEKMLYSENQFTIASIDSTTEVNVDQSITNIKQAMQSFADNKDAFTTESAQIADDKKQIPNQDNKKNYATQPDQTKEKGDQTEEESGATSQKTIEEITTSTLIEDVNSMDELVKISTLKYNIHEVTKATTPASINDTFKLKIPPQETIATSEESSNLLHEYPVTMKPLKSDGTTISINQNSIIQTTSSYPIFAVRDDIETTEYPNMVSTETASSDNLQFPNQIPGEGSCLVDKKTYEHNSIIPTEDKCVISCKCFSSLVLCQHIECDLPRNSENCMQNENYNGSCCPSYNCDVNVHLSEVGKTNSTKDKESDILASKEKEKDENVAEILYMTETIIPKLSTEKPLSHIKHISNNNFTENAFYSTIDNDVLLTEPSITERNENNYISTTTEISLIHKNNFSLRPDEKIYLTTKMPQEEFLIYHTTPFSENSIIDRQKIKPLGAKEENKNLILDFSTEKQGDITDEPIKEGETAFIEQENGTENIAYTTSFIEYNTEGKLGLKIPILESKNEFSEPKKEITTDNPKKIINLTKIEHKPVTFKPSHEDENKMADNFTEIYEISSPKNDQNTIVDETELSTVKDVNENLLKESSTFSFDNEKEIENSTPLPFEVENNKMNENQLEYENSYKNISNEEIIIDNIEGPLEHTTQSEFDKKEVMSTDETMKSDQTKGKFYTTTPTLLIQDSKESKTQTSFEATEMTENALINNLDSEKLPKNDTLNTPIKVDINSLTINNNLNENKKEGENLDNTTKHNLDKENLWESTTLEYSFQDQTTLKPSKENDNNEELTETQSYLNLPVTEHIGGDGEIMITTSSVTLSKKEKEKGYTDRPDTFSKEKDANLSKDEINYLIKDIQPIKVTDKMEQTTSIIENYTTKSALLNNFSHSTLTPNVKDVTILSDNVISNTDASIVILNKTQSTETNKPDIFSEETDKYNTNAFDFIDTTDDIIMNVATTKEPVIIPSLDNRDGVLQAIESEIETKYITTERGYILEENLTTKSTFEIKKDTEITKVPLKVTDQTNIDSTIKPLLNDEKTQQTTSTDVENEIETPDSDKPIDEYEIETTIKQSTSKDSLITTLSPSKLNKTQDKIEKLESSTETILTTVTNTSEMPITTSESSIPHYQPPIYGSHTSPQYPSYSEDEYTDEEEAEVFGPGTCRYGGKLYVSAQQIPRDDPCDFCFCFRSDIICLQQSCPPPITGCHEEPISGFCCPRYECPVSMASVLNITTSTTTTSTTLPPHFLHHSYGNIVQKNGCQISGKSYKVGERIESKSGPCINCTCGGDGQMKCDPQACVPEPTMQQVMAVVASGRKR